jgi:DNA-binding NarL/FixJ family response regulator
MQVVGETEDGLQAIEGAKRRRPDVVVMDIRMPNSTASRRRGGSSPNSIRRGARGLSKLADRRPARGQRSDDQDHIASVLLKLACAPASRP